MFRMNCPHDISNIAQIAVLRRLAAICLTHAGFVRPGFPGKLTDMIDLTFFEPQSSHLSAKVPVEESSPRLPMRVIEDGDHQASVLLPLF